ncbi:MAG TPA: hypothetical protein VN944_11420 [Nitrospiria bacterium]|nr:hypothetical protein [Nitrospiria bacterium]
MELEDPTQILRALFPEIYKLALEQNWNINWGETHTGKGFVEMNSRLYDIRVVKDKGGEIFLEFSAPKKWHDLRSLLGQKEQEIGDIRSESEVVTLFKDNRSKIPDLLENVEKKKTP